jgi:DNA-binding MarR family transcriptional regulator
MQAVGGFMDAERDDSQDDAARSDSGVPLGMLDGLVGYALRRAQIAVFQDFHRTFTEVDIRPAQYSVLLVVHQTPGLRQSQVADALGIKRTNFVTLFDGLQQRGLALRAPVAGDRRAVALHLTEAGEALVGQLMALCDQHEARLTERLGESGRDELLRLLHCLTDI